MWPFPCLRFKTYTTNEKPYACHISISFPPYFLAIAHHIPHLDIGNRALPIIIRNNLEYPQSIEPQNIGIKGQDIPKIHPVYAVKHAKIPSKTAVKSLENTMKISENTLLKPMEYCEKQSGFI